MPLESRDPQDCRLLDPGWAGLLTPAEARYIHQALVQESRLRRHWRIKGKRPRLSTIAEKAYPEDRREAHRQLRNALAREHHREARHR